MLFRSIVRDVRDSIGSLSRCSFDFKLSSLNKEGGKSRGSVQDSHEEQFMVTVQETPWANLPPELLRDVIKRLKDSESVWPARRHVFACAFVFKCWRNMCKDIVQSPELFGKITFHVSLKQDLEMRQCNALSKRDKSNLTYNLKKRAVGEPEFDIVVFDEWKMRESYRSLKKQQPGMKRKTEA